MNGQNDLATTTSSHRPRQRYVAKIKTVCLAIPFDGESTLDEFTEAVKDRISRHRKLKNDSKLRDRIQYIKIQTPHYGELVDVCI